MLRLTIRCGYDLQMAELHIIHIRRQARLALPTLGTLTHSLALNSTAESRLEKIVAGLIVKEISFCSSEDAQESVTAIKHI